VPNTCPSSRHPARLATGGVHFQGAARLRGGRDRRSVSAGRAASPSTNCQGPGTVARGACAREAPPRPGLHSSNSRLRTRLVRRVVPYRPASRLPADDREVSPTGPVGGCCTTWPLAPPTMSPAKSMGPVVQSTGMSESWRSPPPRRSPVPARQRRALWRPRLPIIRRLGARYPPSSP
jgi:hypothetical protein